MNTGKMSIRYPGNHNKQRCEQTGFSGIRNKVFQIPEFGCDFTPPGTNSEHIFGVKELPSPWK